MDGFEAREAMIRRIREIEIPEAEAVGDAWAARADRLMELAETFHAAFYRERVQPVVRKCRRKAMSNRARAGKLAGKLDKLKAFALVPNAHFRRRFVELERRGIITPAQLAFRMGWFKSKDKPEEPRNADTTYALRNLGLRVWTNRKGYPPGYRDAVDYDKAVRLSRVLGMTYQEAGV